MHSRVWLHRLMAALALAPGLLSGVPAIARSLQDLLNQPITVVTLDLEGRPADDPSLVELVETRVGTRLQMAAVRETIAHLFGLGRFQDVRVHADPSPGGVALRYEIVPLHSVQRVLFRGNLGLSEGQLRSTVVERFGASPSVGRAAEISRALAAFYREQGYLAARVTPRTEVEHAPDRTTLIFDIDADRRTTIRTIRIEGQSLLSQEQLLGRLKLQPGRPYERPTILANLGRYADELKSRGYYEARVELTPTFDEESGYADLVVTVDPGPHITVVFEGDPLPSGQRAELVPIEREGSVDEDLLEDSNRRIEAYLQGLGYRDATVENRRTSEDREQRIVFTVRRGSLYIVDGIEISGATAVTSREIQSLLGLESGQPFVKSALDAGLVRVAEQYKRRGFVDANVTPDLGLLARGSSAGPSVSVTIHVRVAEGPQARIRSLDLRGNRALSAQQLRAGLGSEPPRPFYQPQLAEDLDAVVLKYLNLGYQNATATASVTFNEGRSEVALVIDVREGLQVFVDHILIVGNNRTSRATIRRELALIPGRPFGLGDVVESQRRLSALGLFRRARITELRHPGSATRRDVLVTVEEAPLTTIGYGGGVEGGRTLRRVQGQEGAVDVFEFAPRGFFEVGRRNLWGKNRSVNFFARVSLKSNDEVLDPQDPTRIDGGYGFNEYRVLFAYREPRIFGSAADGLASAFLEQGIRPSFNFNRRGVRAEIVKRLTPRVSVLGRYAFDRTRLFDERIRPADKPLIDRLFPQVRLSTVSTSLLRDTRDDPLDPTRGALVGVDGELAARALGSEVGFVKTFLQGFVFRKLPGKKRIVVAGGARLGLGSGFKQEVPVTDEDGNPVIGPDGQPVVATVKDLPASERFFAGGDTTVRGFTLDRLGTPETFDEDGFPIGGHALIIFNGELRFPIWRDLGGVGFVDAGNVFQFVDDLDPSRIRGAVGFGIRYRSPIGPLRIDLGFKLDREEFADGQLERRTALHISFGQAF